MCRFLKLGICLSILSLFKVFDCFDEWPSYNKRFNLALISLCMDCIYLTYGCEAPGFVWNIVYLSYTCCTLHLNPSYAISYRKSNISVIYYVVHNGII
jgi:hypothetical protein